MYILNKSDKNPEKGIEDTPMCGGTNTVIDKSFPKKILSDEIVFFEVESALPIAYNGSAENEELAYIKAFAVPDGDNTFLFLETKDGYGKISDEVSSWAFVKKNIFPQLSKLVRKLDLSKNNGYFSTTHGLPENFGGSISIEYKSGEKIGVSDNQSPVISQSAGRSILSLFKSAMVGEKAYLPDVSELGGIRFSEERANGGFTRVLLTLLDDGTATVEKQEKFSDSGIYESSKILGVQEIAEIKKIIGNTGIFAWANLPRNRYSCGNLKTMTFIFNSAYEITVDDARALPEKISRGFFNLEFLIAINK